jgi:hypothetical protein
MLDRSIPTREALVHSFPISEVKDMKIDVLQALLTLKRNFEPRMRAQFLEFSRKKNCIDFEFLFATFPSLELTFFKSISNSVFPFITYSLLLIDLSEV